MTPPSAAPVDIVARLGAVQAQDYHAAKWGIALRGRDLGNTRGGVRQIDTNSPRKLTRPPQAQSLRDDV